MATKKKNASYEKIISDMRKSYEERLEANNELISDKEDLYLQWKEKKELAERDLKAAQLERNELIEKSREVNVEHEFEVKRLKMNLKN